MNKILSKLFSLLKYVLLVAAIALTFFGVISTYKRLEKPLVEAIPIFIPFLLITIIFIVNIFVKKAKIGENLLFNFTAMLVLLIIIIVGLRAKFDTGMLLYYKYKIDYNPLYLSDNLSSIQIMLYCLFISNLFLLLKSAFTEKDNVNNFDQNNSNLINSTISKTENILKKEDVKPKLENFDQVEEL